MAATKSKSKRGAGKPVVRRDLYAEVTAQVAQALDAGVVPWRQPWKDSVAARFAGDGRARNLASGKAYRGANAVMLPMIAAVNGYADPRWLTFKQARDAGGCVRKGESGSLVVFWKFFTSENAQTGKTDSVPMLRHYVVFNADQVDGLPALPDAELVEPAPIDERCEAVIQGMKLRPVFRRDGSAAFYEPSADRVTMPSAHAFPKLDDYYGVAFHEFAHATGHESRLNRKAEYGAGQFARFGSPDYSREELVAELASCMVSRAVGIDPNLPMAAGYIASWSQKLKDDPKAFVQAAGKAQRAADYILGEEIEVVA